MTAPPQIQPAQPDPQQMGPPILPDGTEQEIPELGVNALLRAVRECAEAGAANPSGAETRDYAQAALFYAQALVVLDPSLSQGGTPLQHDLALEQVRGQTQQNVAAIQGNTQVRVAHTQGEHALRLAKETAAAPTPSRTKTATVRRDQHGRTQSVDVTEH
jgi:hypothetical protein